MQLLHINVHLAVKELSFDLRRKLCSAHPSYAKKPFCAGENADVVIAQEAIRHAMRAKYNL